MENFFRFAAVFALIVNMGCGGAQEKTATTIPETLAEESAKEEEPSDIPLHAEMAAFILSRCPHAAPTVRSLIALKREMGPSLDLRIGYIGMLDENGKPDTAIGTAEIEASKVQICVSMKSSDDEWMDFLECIYTGEQWRTVPFAWKECADRAGVDEDDVEECLESGEGDTILAKAYSVSMSSEIEASPTLIIANRFYLGSHSLESLRRHVCHEVGTAETRPEACAAVEPAVTVAATLLFDSRCENSAMCDVSNETALLQQLIPGLELAKLDFTTDEGRHLWELIKKTDFPLRELPLIVIDHYLEHNGGAIALLGDYLIPFGKGYLLDMGNGWDPLAEICDNKVDDTENGQIDCADPTCAEKIVCRPEKEGRLDLFIMSGCPFSAEILPVIDRVLDHFGRDRRQLNFSLQFIGNFEEGELTSMHGEEEVAEDLRMICAQKLYGKDYRFMEYVTCRAETFDSPTWEPCVPKWMNKKRLRRCAEDKQGIALLKKSFKLADRLGIKGSPSWLQSNRFSMEGRTAEKIVKSFCEKTERTACKQEVTSEPESRKPRKTGTCR
ncbi:MAG: hypothetical protein GY847_10605 [Proteobacteria bacterium]|nr:hypothetical protein [Pseudomonadota bacterium]